MSEPVGVAVSQLEIYAYTSLYAGPPDQLASVMEWIRAVSAVRNVERGITGAIVHDRGRFLQVMEGESAAIDTLVAALARDPRHRDMTKLVRAPIRERTFAGWSMAVYDTGADTSASGPASRGPAEAIDLERMTEAFRANFRLAAADYFECMSRLLHSPSYGNHR